MKKTSIKLGFGRYADGRLAGKARQIVAGMTGNAHFPDPSPSLPDINQQLAEFEAAIGALNGSRLNTTLKNTARNALIHSLQLLGLYVLQHADGDEARLRSSGFDLTGAGSRAYRTLSAPEGFRVVNGDPEGAMQLSCDKVAGARSYLFQYTDAPLTGDSQWETETGTVPVLQLEGLTPHKAYCFRIAVAGRGRKLVYSNVLVKYVN